MKNKLLRILRTSFLTFGLFLTVSGYQLAKDLDRFKTWEEKQAYLQEPLSRPALALYYDYLEFSKQTKNIEETMEIVFKVYPRTRRLFFSGLSLLLLTFLTTLITHKQEGREYIN